MDATRIVKLKQISLVRDLQVFAHKRNKLFVEMGFLRKMSCVTL